MRVDEAAAWDISEMMNPNWPSGKNTYTRYRLNCCHSPSVRVPSTIWMPAA